MCEIIFIVNIEAIFVCINRREMNETSYQLYI